MGGGLFQDKAHLGSLPIEQGEGGHALPPTRSAPAALSWDIIAMTAEPLLSAYSLHIFKSLFWMFSFFLPYPTNVLSPYSGFQV